MSHLPTTRILFVCLGNICRSPLAEGVFLHRAEEQGVSDRLEVESAGTGAWHVGNLPDPRSREVAARHGISLTTRARQVRESDFHDFDLIVAMDTENLRDLERLRKSAGGDARLHLFREFDEGAEEDLDVPDPYFGGPEGFDGVFQMVERASAGLLAHLLAETGQGKGESSEL